MDLGREFNSRGLRRRNRKMGFDCCRNNYVKMKPAPFNVVLVGFGCCCVLDQDKKKEESMKSWRKRRSKQYTRHTYTTNKPNTSLIFSTLFLSLFSSIYLLCSYKVHPKIAKNSVTYMSEKHRNLFVFPSSDIDFSCDNKLRKNK